MKQLIVGAFCGLREVLFWMMLIGGSGLFAAIAAHKVGLI